MRNRNLVSLIVALVLAVFLAVPGRTQQTQGQFTQTAVVGVTPTSARLTGIVGRQDPGLIQGSILGCVVPGVVQSCGEYGSCAQFYGNCSQQYLIADAADGASNSLATFNMNVGNLDPGTQYTALFRSQDWTSRDIFVQFTTPAVGAPIVDTLAGFRQACCGAVLVDAVVTSGGYIPGLVRGSLGSIFGTNFETGTTVTLNGVSTKIVGVSPSQVVFQVPMIAGGAPIQVVVTNSKGSTTATSSIVAANPSVLKVDIGGSADFVLTATGLGEGMISQRRGANIEQAGRRFTPNVQVAFDDGTVGTVRSVTVGPDLPGTQQVNVVLSAPIVGTHKGILTVGGVSTAFVIPGK